MVVTATTTKAAYTVAVLTGAVTATIATAEDSATVATATPATAVDAATVVVVVVNRGSLPGLDKHESASDFQRGHAIRYISFVPMRGKTYRHLLNLWIHSCVFLLPQ